MKQKQKIKAESNAFTCNLNRPKRRACIKQENEDSKEYFKHALYASVKIEPSSSLKINKYENTDSTETLRSLPSKDIENQYCDICDITFMKKDQKLHSHKTKEIPIIDLETPKIKRTKQKKDYSKRKAIVHLKSSKEPIFDILNLHCNVCIGPYFDTKRSYIRHFALMHGEALQKVYSEPSNFDAETKHCKVCDIKFGGNYNFNVHLKKIHHVTSHSRSHLIPNVNDQNNYCLSCDKLYYQRRTYLYHLYNQHLEEMPELYQGIDCINPSKKNLSSRKYCSDCQKLFVLKCFYRIHLDKFHGIKLDTYSPDMLDGLKVNRCTLCDKTFSNRSGCGEHMRRTHHLSLPSQSKTAIMLSTVTPIPDLSKKYCNVCNITLTTLHYYRNHMYNLHYTNLPSLKPPSSSVNRNEISVTDEIGSHCVTCDKVYSSRDSYEKHLHSFHGVELLNLERNDPDMNNKDNYCTSCDKTYSSKASYRKHLANIHNMKRTKIKQEDTKEKFNI